ncbi:MAG: hypothetical protein R3293_03425 [Candidatus Promineifilaceae bacterium]|nr:hypothetical protein [Candidatus Promineifilaceae bacterium]
MAKAQKRRVKKNRPHQHQKSSGISGKSINWTRIAVIAIGIIIALSMLLSLIITPGTGLSN